MSKVLLAAGLDLLREAERAEMDADKLYEQIIKSGDKNKNFHPVRENLRSAYQKWIRALETVNFVRRAAVEAERLKKLQKQLAKLSSSSSATTNTKEDGEMDQQQQEETATEAASAGGVLVTDAAASKMQHNQKRGLAAVSDEMIRNGVPHEIISLCDQRMRLGFEHCEKIREKEASLLLSLRDADPHKEDCSRSRPNYQVAQVLAFRDASPNAPENQGLLQGNWTVTVPAVDGSYQILIKNLTDVLVAAPDVTCQVIATWKPVSGTNQVEKREFRGPCPPGAAFLRSFGVVGNEGTIFVHVNSNGMRSSRVEVVVRRLIPQSSANLTSNPPSPTAAAAANHQNQAQQNQQQQQQQPNGQLSNLLPPIVPLGGGVPQQQQQQFEPMNNVVVDPAQQQQQQQMMMMNSMYQQNMITEQNSHFQDAHYYNNQQQPPQEQQQQQNHTMMNNNTNSNNNLTASQVKKKVMKLIESIEYEFPSEVVAPVGSGEGAGTDESSSSSSSFKEEYQKLVNKRTPDERAFESFLMELPEPTNLFGDDDDNKQPSSSSGTGTSTRVTETDESIARRQAEADRLIADLAQNMGPTLDDLREMEEQMMGLEEEDD